MKKSSAESAGLFIANSRLGSCAYRQSSWLNHPAVVGVGEAQSTLRLVLARLGNLE